MNARWPGRDEPGGGFSDYAAFVRSTTPHLQLVPLRPVLGVSRWLVSSSSHGMTFRPVPVFGSETRARNRAQSWHAAHVQAIAACAAGLDADLASGNPRVRAELRRLWSDHPELARMIELQGPIDYGKGTAT